MKQKSIWKYLKAVDERKHEAESTLEQVFLGGFCPVNHNSGKCANLILNGLFAPQD